VDSRVLAQVARGDGLTTAAALRHVGVGERHLARLVRTRQLVAVRRGVYTTAELWGGWDEYHQRPLARVRAAEHSIAVDHVSSHDSSALVHGLPLLRPQDAAVHITRTDMRGTRVQNGIEHHGAAYGPDQVQEVDGLAVLDIPRTVADLAREHGYRAGLVAADGAMQLGVSRSQLRQASGRMTGWPYSLTVAAVVEDADPGAESAGETLARELVVECGLGQEIETQFPVRMREGVAWVDLRVGRHLVEFDGRVKYRAVEAGGVRDRELEQVLWEQRKRASLICADGYGLTPLVYADFWDERREWAKQRLRREYAVTTNRYGSQLTPAMLEFADRLRGQRYRVAT
jgi:hypothetical protein